MPSKCANVKSEKRYKLLKEKGMSKSWYLKRRWEEGGVGLPG